MVVLIPMLMMCAESPGGNFREMEHLEGRTGGSAGPMGSAQQVASGRAYCPWTLSLNVVI